MRIWVTRLRDKVSWGRCEQVGCVAWFALGVIMERKIEKGNEKLKRSLEEFLMRLTQRQRESGGVTDTGTSAQKTE